MAVGKNKRLTKGKKGAKRKIVDPMTRKEWYHIRAPGVYKNRDVGETLVNRTSGKKYASEALKGRVFEASLADLNGSEDYAYRKIFLRCEDVQGKNVLTNFYGMDFTTDKLRSLVRKWQTLIEAHVDVKTLDGYVLRLFCIGFTKRRPNQVRKTSYAKTSQVKLIRKKMVDTMTKHATTSDLKSLVKKFNTEVIGQEVEKACHSVYPIQNVYIRKVKLLRAPKADTTKLMELHGEVTEEVGTEV